MHDHIIVGAGSAGCALAARLSEDPDTDVLLLEAGGAGLPREVAIPVAFSRLFGTDVDWAFHTVPQPVLDGRTLYWPRGRMLGGSSAINALMWVRGVAADYDAWAADGNQGWGYDDVAPLLDRAERRIGGGRLRPLRRPNPATDRFVAACVAAGIPPTDDPNGRTNDGVALTRVTQRRGRRVSTADAYLGPARNRPNLTVVDHAHATRVLLDDGRAVGVAYLRDVGYGGPAGRTVAHEARAAGQVVLCGGAVSSPQLLLLSGIGPADELRAIGVEPAVDLPGVGRNLTDHLAAGIVVATDRDDTLIAAERPRHVAEYLLRGRGPLASNVAEAHAFLRTRSGLAGPDLELIFGAAPFVDHGRAGTDRHGYTVGAVLLQPSSTGAVTLASTDPLAAPRIDPRYLTDPADLPGLVAGLRRALDVLDTSPLRELVSGIIQPATWPRTDGDLVATIRAHAETLYHPVGTCRMGVDEDAVVDDELRVHGVDGLRVADASVMPRIIRGHTHAPAVMIGERAAELVTGRTAPRPTPLHEESRP